MSDLFAFVLTAAVATKWWSSGHKRNERPPPALFQVNSDNKSAPEQCRKGENDVASVRILVMHDPPHMFYEPKEWSHTSVLLCCAHEEVDGSNGARGVWSLRLTLPWEWRNEGESCTCCAARCLCDQLGVDVHQPENSLHPLFTFPYEEQAPGERHRHRWAGSLEDLYAKGIARGSIRRVSLEDISNWVEAKSAEGASSCQHKLQIVHQRTGDDANDSLRTLIGAESTRTEKTTHTYFSPDTYHALRLYLQRQDDLRAKRRLMKGYSSSDLERYKLHTKESNKVVFSDEKDTTRHQALDYTMKTDDGQSPPLLFEADLILLGASRVGKTPFSLVLSQNMCLKVANVPLVVDVPPPPQLFKVNPRRVFCLTATPEELQMFGKSRLRRELKGIKRTSKDRKTNSYADMSYVKKDLEHAKQISFKHGFTEIHVTGRAIEETAMLIASKLSERFPNADHGIAF